MQSLDQHFKKNLFHLTIFIVVIIGILVTVLLLFQQSIEKHYTIQKEQSLESIIVHKSIDEEYKFIGTNGTQSSMHATMIPDIELY